MPEGTPALRQACADTLLGVKNRKTFFPERAWWGNVARGAAAGTGRTRRGHDAAVGASGRRSLTERPPTRRPAPVQCTGWLLWQSYTVPAMGGWCGSCTGPRAPGLRSRAAADLYAFGQWSAAWSHLARSSRSVGPKVWALVWLHHASGRACSGLAVALRSTLTSACRPRR